MSGDDKQLKDKAVNIKGKSYVLVSDRVLYFNEAYPNGCIWTSYKREGDTYEFMATVVPDTDKPGRRFTGHSQATIGDGIVNKTAAMENSETSAVGRALAMLGIGVIESIASADEMNKAVGSQGTPSKPRRASTPQIQMLAQKVQQGLKMYDRDEVISFLDAALGKSVTELMSNEVDEALKKVDQAIRHDKIMATMEPEKKPSLVDEAEAGTLQLDKDADIKLEDIPF